MNKFVVLMSLCSVLAGCGADLGEPPALGMLAVSLSSVAGGVEYQLADGHFSLEGPSEQELDTGNEPTLAVELAAGAYRLTLQPGYRLVRSDDPERKSVPARLVSANPATVLVSAGETAHLTLRFELSAGASTEAGTLQIDLAVDASGADAGAGGCSGTLLLTELDYEQAGTDEAEFVELLNPSACPAPLAGVVLELVNGGDGKVYSRYDLGTIAPALAPGGRLVLGDTAVLGALPAGTLSAPLNGSGLQNGPDGVRLVRAEKVLDALSYEGEIAGFPGTPGPADEAEQGLSRCPEASAAPLRLSTPTPGVVNLCM
jgi:hypothetical protein